jgi:hypothetical protein
VKRDAYRRWGLAQGVLMLVAVGCRSPEPSTSPDDARVGEADRDDAASAPLVPDVAPVYATGEPLEARIPGLDGASLDLEQLRGRVAVLAFVDPATPAIVEHLARHSAIAAADDVAFVLVASEASTTREFGGLDAWIGRPDVFVGWDPQGALATKLRIERVPTTLVLDHDGRVVGELNDPTEATLGAALDRARQSGSGSRGAAAGASDMAGATPGSDEPHHVGGGPPGDRDD